MQQLYRPGRQWINRRFCFVKNQNLDSSFESALGATHFSMVLLVMYVVSKRVKTNIHRDFVAS